MQLRFGISGIVFLLTGMVSISKLLFLKLNNFIIVILYMLLIALLHIGANMNVYIINNKFRVLCSIPFFNITTYSELPHNVTAIYKKFEYIALTRVVPQIMEDNIPPPTAVSTPQSKTTKLLHPLSIALSVPIEMNWASPAASVYIII